MLVTLALLFVDTADACAQGVFSYTYAIALSKDSGDERNLQSVAGRVGKYHAYRATYPRRPGFFSHGLPTERPKYTSNFSLYRVGCDDGNIRTWDVLINLGVRVPGCPASTKRINRLRGSRWFLALRYGDYLRTTRLLLEQSTGLYVEGRINW